MDSVSLANWVMSTARGMREHRPSKSRARGTILSGEALSQLRNNGPAEPRPPGQNQDERKPYGTMSSSVVNVRGGGVASIFRFKFGRLHRTLFAPLERRIMKKLNKVASLFATAALASSFTGVSAQTNDNWVSGFGLPWKNMDQQLCWRDGFWTPATGMQGCDGVPPPPAPPAPAPGPGPAHAPPPPRPPPPPAPPPRPAPAPAPAPSAAPPAAAVVPAPTSEKVTFA